jgi:tryptophan-rich sensory protein
MLILVEIGVLMLMSDLLILLIHLMSYLSSWLFACYLLWSLCED